MDSEGQDDRVSAIGLLRYAKSYHEASLVLHSNQLGTGDRWNEEVYPLYYPTCYLVAHTIELSLKAFLRAKGYSVKDLKNKLRHDLERLLNACREESIENFYKITNIFSYSISMINPLVMNQELKYYLRGVKELIDISDALICTGELIESIEPLCRQASLKSNE